MQLNYREVIYFLVTCKVHPDLASLQTKFVCLIFTNLVLIIKHDRYDYYLKLKMYSLTYWKSYAISFLAFEAFKMCALFVLFWILTIQCLNIWWQISFKFWVIVLACSWPCLAFQTYKMVSNMQMPTFNSCCEIDYLNACLIIENSFLTSRKKLKLKLQSVRSNYSLPKL